MNRKLKKVEKRQEETVNERRERDGNAYLPLFLFYFSSLVSPFHVVAIIEEKRKGKENEE